MDPKARRELMARTTALYWFGNDLRVEDNPALRRAAASSDQLLCVYTVDPAWFKPNRYQLKALGNHRWRFLQESLNALKGRLREFDQELVVTFGPPLASLTHLMRACDVRTVFRSETAGLYEEQQWQTLTQHHPESRFATEASHTLFRMNQLPFSLHELPETFTQFRKRVEPLGEVEAPASVIALPPMPQKARLAVSEAFEPLSKPTIAFRGGETAAALHLKRYFGGDLPSRYKEVRNELDGWDNSTKLSAWLANGCVSAKTVLRLLGEYEATHGQNESTYWIRFELLWREYFQWYAHRHKQRLFAFSGIKRRKPLTTFYAERFRRWCAGNTPYALVNACMKQLNATGFLSNRGRQLVASCFVNELGLDWRYGAAYFEQQLIDYDVASNWGNWQYLAGVGADPHGKRKFNLKKQAATYDPNGAFVEKWRGEAASQTLDAVDAADWPIA